jgi:hypothetical protein
MIKLDRLVDVDEFRIVVVENCFGRSHGEECGRRTRKWLDEACEARQVSAGKTLCEPSLSSRPF